MLVFIAPPKAFSIPKPNKAPFAPSFIIVEVSDSPLEIALPILNPAPNTIASLAVLLTKDFPTFLATSLATNLLASLVISLLVAVLEAISSSFSFKDLLTISSLTFLVASSPNISDITFVPSFPAVLSRANSNAFLYPYFFNSSSPDITAPFFISPPTPTVATSNNEVDH